MPTQVLSNNFEIPPSPVDHSSHVLPDPDGYNELEAETEEVFTDWDNWDKPAAPHVSQESKFSQEPKQHSRYGSRPSQEPDPEPEPDYFSDLGLAPTIKKQKKTVYFQYLSCWWCLYPETFPQQSNRLAFTPDLAAPISTELEEWDDSTGAWDGEDISLEETELLARQTRKAERERRLAEHQKRNQDKEQQKLNKDNARLATKIS
ncbi:hypothetical protein EB796_010413 [Bugula neritina]|uniref:Uncharacterized protein n=1 Tax=Bugula neritina TaxID=10212 RepID=A0A7J7JY14_BUGNE|nr:hypothetical protein EB796_010413 [Bugula neritina]